MAGCPGEATRRRDPRRSRSLPEVVRDFHGTVTILPSGVGTPRRVADEEAQPPRVTMSKGLLSTSVRLPTSVSTEQSAATFSAVTTRPPWETASAPEQPSLNRTPSLAAGDRGQQAGRLPDAGAAVERVEPVRPARPHRQDGQLQGGAADRARRGDHLDPLQSLRGVGGAGDLGVADGRVGALDGAVEPGLQLGAGVLEGERDRGGDHGVALHGDGAGVDAPRALGGHAGGGGEVLLLRLTLPGHRGAVAPVGAGDDLEERATQLGVLGGVRDGQLAPSRSPGRRRPAGSRSDRSPSRCRVTDAGGGAAVVGPSGSGSGVVPLVAAYATAPPSSTSAATTRAIARGSRHRGGRFLRCTGSGSRRGSRAASAPTSAAASCRGRGCRGRARTGGTAPRRRPGRRRRDATGSGVTPRSIVIGPRALSKSAGGAWAARAGSPARDGTSRRSPAAASAAPGRAVGVLGEHRLELPRQRVGDGERRRHAGDVPVGDGVVGAGTGERGTAGEQLVEQDAGAVDVGGQVAGAGHEQLGRHVLRGAHQAGGGAGAVGDHPRDAEVGEPHRARRRGPASPGSAARCRA